MDNQLKPSNVPGFKFPIKIGPRSLMIAGAVIILLAAGGVGFWYFRGGEIPFLTSKPEEASTKDGLGAEALNKVNNPLANELPETNPFNVNTNPFEKQKNAFDSLYKNPFE